MPRALISQGSASAGEREHYITIQQVAEGVAASNYPTEGGTQLMKVWAAREYVTLGEDIRADQLSASVVMRWNIPYSIWMDPDRVDVAKERRIVYLGRTYDILSAELVERGRGRSIVLSTLAKVG